MIGLARPGTKPASQPGRSFSPSREEVVVRARGFGAALRKACLGISTVALLATSGACAVAQRGAPTTKTHVMALASD
ncbi:MAG: hypothetical protein ACXWVP_08365, partial [Burkholderiales bacterium]